MTGGGHLRPLALDECENLNGPANVCNVVIPSHRFRSHPRATTSSALISFLGILLAALVIGCGGGGSASGTTTTTGGGTTGAVTQRVTFYATDNADANDHVYATIYSATITGAGGSVSLYNNSTGLTLDLKSLANKFLFLGDKSVTGGEFDKLSVVMAKSITVYPAGAKTAQTRFIANSFDNGSNTSKVTFNLARERGTSSTDDTLVVDFDLASWTDDGTTITPVLKEHNGSGLDNLNNHVSQLLRGTISGLTTTSFKLTDKSNGQATISTTGTTGVEDSFGNSTTLADGKEAEATIVYNRSTRSYQASFVRVKAEDDPTDWGANLAEVKGTVVSFANEASITVAATRAEHFVPTATNVVIVTNANTVFVGSDGKPLGPSGFYGTLVAGDALEVNGVYNAASAIFTASLVRIDK